MKASRLGLAYLPILALWLAGCASFQPQPIHPEATAAAFESRTLDDPALRQFLQQRLHQHMTAWPPTTWDLRLLVLAAFYYHPDLDLARAKWRVAEAGIITAGARSNPTASLSAQHNADAPDHVSPWTLGGTLGIPLETAGKRGHRIEQARQLSTAARLGIGDAAWRVRSRVRGALLGLYSTEPLLGKQAALQAETVRLIARRLAVGAISQPELTQAQIALNQTTLALREAQKQLAERRAQLATALGVPVSALGGANLSVEAFEQVSAAADLPAAEVRRQALLARPDVLAALAEYEASQSALQLEVAKQYPDVSLGPGYTWDAGQAKWSLGVSLVLPVLNHNEGPIAEGEARRKQAAANFTAIQTRAIGEVEQALAGYRFVVEKLAAADATLAAQRKNEKSATARYQAGETDRLASLGAQLETVAAELARTETLIQTQQSLGILEDAMQRPLTKDAPDISAAETDPRKEDDKK